MTSIKQHIFRFLYKYIGKPVFFRIDPEVTHDVVLWFGRMLGKYSLLQKCTRWCFDYRNPALSQHIAGIHFPNPVGVAAGFDKNAQLMSILPEVGFGFEEIGSVTGKPCAGNAKPRLWRLKKSQSLLVYYGLKNDGCEVVKTRVAGKSFRFPIGISIAKTNNTETVDAQKGIADYVQSYRTLATYADYIAINISCPNSFGGLAFTDAHLLDQLLAEIEKEPLKKPVFLKLSKR